MPKTEKLLNDVSTWADGVPWSAMGEGLLWALLGLGICVALALVEENLPGR